MDVISSQQPAGREDDGQLEKRLQDNYYGRES